MTSPVSMSVISVPTGMRSVMSSPPRRSSRSPAVFAVPRHVLLGVAEVDQRVDVAVGLANTLPPRPPSPPSGPPKGKFLAPKRSASVAAVAGDRFDTGFVNELHVGFPWWFGLSPPALDGSATFILAENKSPAVTAGPSCCKGCIRPPERR
jgi:hypothetical protein